MDFYHSEDFQEQINLAFNMIDKKIKNFISKNASLNSNEEICGFIIHDGNNFKCIACDNISDSKKDNFKINSKKYLEIKNKYKIYYIYHSHINDNEDFSIKDKSCAENLDIPIILYHLKTNKFKIYEPINVKNEYVGRFYQHGKYDCFKLVEDFYKKEKSIEFKYDKNFYVKDLENMDIKNEIFKFYEKNNFEIINKNEKLNIYDILLIDAFGQNNPKHFALYLGEEKILHQPMFGFSKIENYCNFYKRNTDTIFRLKI